MDLRFTQDKKWFGYGAKAIIIEDNQVLMITKDSHDYYYPVGGGVMHGETAEEAVVREVFEETGIKYQVDRLAFIYESFFDGNNDSAFKNMDCHEISLYFLMKPQGIKHDFKSNSFGLDGVKEKLCWLPIRSLDKIKLYPQFFKTYLNNMPTQVRHIVIKHL